MNPFKETDRADHPLTLYATTKKATEDMAHSYAHLWKIPTTALRFNGNGQMKRDFTYIDDLIEATSG